MGDARIKVARGLMVKEIGEEMVVLDNQHGQIHQLNLTATFIWRHLDGATPLSTITKRLIEKFDVDHDVAEADVTTIVDKLKELKLLEN